MNMTTAYTFVPSQEHEFPEHPESPARLDVLQPLLNSMAAERIDAREAAVEQVARVHTPQMIKTIGEVCKSGPGVIDRAPTYITRTTYQDALLAAGGVLECTRAVLNGTARNAFAIVRPPGHHAEPGNAMGFCIFNNIAIAAREALAGADGHTPLQRVMVIDYDAHHGNGTQSAFLHEERAGFISTHQWGIYPGSGWFKDAPHARKRMVNVPLHDRAGDETYAQVSDRIFKPVVHAFRPQMILVSAGFDAHWNDPLTSLGLSTHGYYEMSKKLVELADEVCGGRIVFVLEGGYDPHNVANGTAAVFDALTHSPCGMRADDPSPYADVDHGSRIREILNWHGIP